MCWVENAAFIGSDEYLSCAQYGVQSLTLDPVLAPVRRRPGAECSASKTSWQAPDRMPPSSQSGGADEPQGVDRCWPADRAHRAAVGSRLRSQVPSSSAPGGPGSTDPLTAVSVLASVNCPSMTHLVALWAVNSPPTCRSLLRATFISKSALTP